MSIKDFFRPVKSISAEEVRSIMKEKKPGDYNLIDVRQLREYEKSHIPGARLFPLGEITEHLNEIDPAKPTIAY